MVVASNILKKCTNNTFEKSKLSAKDFLEDINRRDSSVIRESCSSMRRYLKQWKALQEVLYTDAWKKIFENLMSRKICFMNRDPSPCRKRHMSDFFRTDKFGSIKFMLCSFGALQCSGYRYHTTSFNKVPT